ncbi:IPTL-CTERM sorting domain-containing protein [Xylophilus sp. ASV27]|uniref:IPTL-CTERM sorting domain-containing protein n=1 Tax=Xylophilus sp. ASV27 TaxID=2795129 RepID=UPI0018EBC198|nr:IPTL-CTERM sorting domain-containing protein [Xylophilus sp. ASV27]
MPKDLLSRASTDSLSQPSFTPRHKRSWAALLAVPLLFAAGGASAQNFLANKKFNPTDINANSSTTLQFDLFNSTSGNLNATLKDTLPATTPVGQLWFLSSDVPAVIQGSATSGCTAGVITYSDYFDPPNNTKARTITITSAVVPPRPAGTVEPNCSVTVPVYAGAVSADSNLTNTVPGTDATATDASGQSSQSQDFSATLRVRAPVDPLPTTKTFSPSLVTGGANSTLTITVRNNTSNPAVPLSGVTFNDALPGGLTTNGAPTFSSGCGSPTTTTTAAGAAAVQMGGGSIAAGATCTVTVQVTAPATSGPLLNTIAVGGVTATGSYSNSVPAQAALYVRNEIKMTKAFGNPAGNTWYTTDAPVPADLYGTAFNTSAAGATASVNQPVPVRVYFSNPRNTDLTGGTLTDSLPGSTVSVAGPVTGTCGNLPGPIAAGQTTVSINGFSVPAAANGQPGTCYVQFYVKTTDVTAAAINELSTAGRRSDVTFSGVDTTLFPKQATSANLTTSGTPGPGVGDGTVATDKRLITADGKSYTGSALDQAAHVEKGEKFWMRVAALNTTFDADYQNGSIVDTLPPGLKVASPQTVLYMQNPPAPYGDGAPVASSGCSVQGSVAVGGSDGKTITYSGWTLLNAAGPNNTSPRNLGCFYNILLESDDAAAPRGSDSINTIKASDVIATVVGTSRTVTATGDVAARVIVRSDLDTTKSFSPSTIGMGPGAVTRLTIAFNNKSSSAITNLAVTDPLPSSASFGTLTVASPANVNNTCGGTLTATSGAATVSLAGGTVPAKASCQIQVDVVRNGGTVGDATVTNTIATGGVTNDQGQSNLEPVTATLTKSGNVGISVVKSFAQSSALGGRAVPLTLDFTATTGSSGPQDKITLTDNLPAGMQVSQVPNMSTTCQKADGSPADVSIAADRSSFTISGFRFAEYTNGLVPNNRCSLTLSMVLTTTGNKTNTIPAGAITTDVFSTNPSPTQATLSAQPNTALQKQFSPGSVAAGQISTLTLSIINVNAVARTDFNLTDTFPAGMTVAGAGATTCGDGVVTAVIGSGSVSIAGGDVGANATCTITVPVRAATAGKYINDSSNITATNYIDTTPTRGELDVTPAPPTPPTAIPTLSEWGLIILSMLLAGFALRRLPPQAGRRM